MKVINNNFNGCTIVEINDNNQELCVLGVLTTDAGVEIEKEMVNILQKHYHIIEVIQNAPGVLYEYPALKYAQKLVSETNKPCLYVHTKGAASINYIQPHVRMLWYTQFVNHKNEYFKLVDSEKETVACPFTGSGR